MEWTQQPLGIFQTNCYLLTNSDGEALIMDPGADPDQVSGLIEEKNVKPLAIFLTHAHLDHIGAVDALREKWSIPVYLHEREKDWLSDPDLNGSSHFPDVTRIQMKPADHLIHQEQKMTIGSFTFQILETPGHSPGSISFYFEQDHVVFSGDTLFYGGIGRTDLYGGDRDELFDTIEKKLLSLPDETVVAPGHGFETTIRHEKESNPFLF